MFMRFMGRGQDPHVLDCDLPRIVQREFAADPTDLVIPASRPKTGKPLRFDEIVFFSL